MMGIQNLAQDVHRISTRICHKSVCCSFVLAGKWRGLQLNWQSVRGLKKIFVHREEHTSLEESKGENCGGKEERSSQNSSKKGKIRVMLLHCKSSIVCRCELNSLQMSKTTPKIVVECNVVHYLVCFYIFVISILNYLRQSHLHLAF